MSNCTANLLVYGDTCVATCPKDSIQDGRICVVCGEDEPFYNTDSKKCQACPFVKPLFDRNTMKCEACPKGMEYDYDDKECVRSIDETIMVRDGEMSYN